MVHATPVDETVAAMLGSEAVVLPSSNRDGTSSLKEQNNDKSTTGIVNGDERVSAIEIVATTTAPPDNNNNNNIGKVLATECTVETKSPKDMQLESNTNSSSSNNSTSCSKTTTINSTSNLSPRRRIKKRREDDFVYASDKKSEAKEESSIGIANTHSTTTTDKLTLTSSPVAPSFFTKTSNNNKDDNNNKHEDTVLLKQKEPQKRPRKCPAKDTILINVPLSASIDLGVAMKRTRRKRIKRIKQWVKSGQQQAAAAAAATKNAANDEKEGDTGSKDGQNHNGDNIYNDDDDDDDDDEDEDEEERLNPKQFGESLIDYLEAKYARGVMIDDIDERERAKERKRKQNKKQQKDGSGTGSGESDDNDDEDDSLGKRSCYDSDDGWIDDSLLHDEVAGQVLASSAYGCTKIEEEARNRRKKGKSKSTAAAVNRTKQIDVAAGDCDKSNEDISDDDNDISDEGEESDFEDGFFVNIGDLEMAEGWNGEQDMLISPLKKKQAKKKRKKKATTTAGGGGTKSDAKTVKKKTIKAKNEVGAKKKLAKKVNVSNSSSSTGGKKKTTVDAKTTTPKKKKTGVATSANSSKKESIKKKSDNVAIAIAASSSSSGEEDSNSKSTKSSAATPKKKPEISEEKAKATRLRKLFKRRYATCVKCIGDMTKDELPRKPRQKTMKVSVNIPLDKEIGDEILFTNPNVPGQKLKSKIPKKADMEQRCFTVTIPLPKVKEETKDNKLSKAFKDAVYNYSTAFDEWCDAEGEHNQSLEKSKRKEFKPNIEKQKKFDEMVTEFPKNLATPIDVSVLKKIARQEKNNRAKKEKRAAEREQKEVELSVPHQGQDFPSVKFDVQDFQEQK